MNNRRDILDDLLEKGFISTQQKNIVLTEQKISGKSVESLLVSMGYLTEDAFVAYVAAFRNCTWISLADYKDSLKDVASLFPFSLLEKHCMVPVHHDSEKHTLTVVMADVGDIEAHDAVQQHMMHYHVDICIAKKSEIMEALHALAPERNILSGLQHHIDDCVIHEFLYKLITDAAHMGASDIHCDPEKYSLRIRYRLDGMLKTMDLFHKTLWTPLCIQIKILSGMDIAETRRPQDGRFSFSILARTVDFRVSAYPVFYGEKIVLRILDQQKSLISLENLGYSSTNIVKIQNMMASPEGLIIVTGPTGSGKTTSLYSMISALEHANLNVMTLEEPIEYCVPFFNQTEVKENGVFSLSHAIPSLLRQDPDVILIGEIRDENTAAMVLRAGMTGHLVFTTLHTINTVNTLQRLVELKLSFPLLTGVLKGIVAQRLIRILCASCKQLAEEIEGIRVYKHTGCAQCFFTGYKGQKAIAEVLIIDEVLENIMLQTHSMRYIREFLVKSQFHSLYDDAFHALCAGLTSREEIERVLGKNWMIHKKKEAQ